MDRHLSILLHISLLFTILDVIDAVLIGEVDVTNHPAAVTEQTSVDMMISVNDDHENGYSIQAPVDLFHLERSFGHVMNSQQYHTTSMERSFLSKQDDHTGNRSDHFTAPNNVVQSEHDIVQINPISQQSLYQSTYCNDINVKRPRASSTEIVNCHDQFIVAHIDDQQSLPLKKRRIFRASTVNNDVQSCSNIDASTNQLLDRRDTIEMIFSVAYKSDSQQSPSTSNHQTIPSANNECDDEYGQDDDQSESDSSSSKPKKKSRNKRARYMSDTDDEDYHPMKKSRNIRQIKQTGRYKTSSIVESHNHCKSGEIVVQNSSGPVESENVSSSPSVKAKKFQLPSRFLLVHSAPLSASDLITLIVDAINYFRSAVLYDGVSLKQSSNNVMWTRWAILRCLRYHYHGNLQQFVAQWGSSVSLKRFSCTGRSPRCSTLSVGKKGRPASIPAGSPSPWDKIDFTPMQQLRYLTATEQKLAVISSIWDRVKDIEFRIPVRYRQYVGDIITPVMKCYHDHCDSNIDLFKAKWGGNFKHTHFGWMRCPGPEWRRAGQPLPNKNDDDPSKSWQLYVMRNYGQVWPAEEKFDINKDLSSPDIMTVCGSVFGNADWESGSDQIPDFSDLKGKSVKEQLAEVRTRYGRFRHGGFSRSSYSAWRFHVLRCIMTCLNEHCGGYEEEFESRFPSFYAGNFKSWCHGQKDKPCQQAQK